VGVSGGLSARVCAVNAGEARRSSSCVGG